MRRTVEGLLLVQDHRVPYVLLLQDGNEFRLPGGHLRPGEGEVEGLQRKLTSCLSPKPKEGVPDLKWEIGDLLSVWWRPNWEPVEFPYLPTHCARSKECRKLFIVPLPEKAKFAVPKNRKLLAVPLFELYNNSATFGQSIASIPHLVSRFTFTIIDSAKAEPAPSDASKAASQSEGATKESSSSVTGKAMAVDAPAAEDMAVEEAPATTEPTTELSVKEEPVAMVD